MNYFKIILILLSLYILYRISQDYSEGFEATSVPPLLNNWNAINQLSEIAGKFSNGIFSVPKGLEIANKWGLYDTGDNWLRLNGIGNNTTTMTGDTGIAMQKLSVNTTSNLNGDTTVKGTLQVNGNISTTGNLTLSSADSKNKISINATGDYLRFNNGTVDIVTFGRGGNDMYVPDLYTGALTVGKNKNISGTGWNINAGGNATLGLVNGRNILAELNALASLQFDNNNSKNMDTLVKDGTCKNYTQCVDRMCNTGDFGGCGSKIANARGPVCTKYYSVISYSPGDASDSRYPGWK